MQKNLSLLIVILFTIFGIHAYTQSDELGEIKWLHATQNFSNQAKEQNIISLNDTTIVVAYKNSSSEKGHMKYGLIQGDSIDWRTDQVFSYEGLYGPQHPILQDQFSISRVSDSKFIITWLADVPGGYEWYYLYAEIYLVQDVIHIIKKGTLGTIYTFETNLSALGLSYNKCLIACSDDNSSGQIKVGTMTETDITFGEKIKFCDYNAFFTRMTKLSDSKFAIAYTDYDSYDKGYIRVGELLGASINFGPEAAFYPQNVNQIELGTLVTDTIALCYSVNGNTLKGRICSIDNLNISFGTTSNIKYGINPYQRQIGMDALCEQNFVVSYLWEGNIYTKACDRTGMNLTQSAPTLAFSGDGYVSITKVNERDFVVSSWDIESSSNFGKSRLGSHGLGMEITSINVEQFTNDIILNGQNQKLLKVTIETNNSDFPLEITQFNISTDGTQDTDILDSLKIFYTGMDDTFLFDNPYGQAVIHPDGNETISDSIILATGSNHFWVCYDLLDYQNLIGNSVDANLISILVDGELIELTNGNPSGDREIIGLDHNPQFALQFNGNESGINLGLSSIIRPVNEITICMWAYHTNWDSFNSQRLISNKSGSGGGYSLGAGNGQIEAGIQASSGNSIYTNTYGFYVTSGWHHITASFDGRYLKLYIDGKLVDTEDAGDYYQINYNDTISTWVGANPSYPTFNNFSGKMDDLRIYNRALSDIEIRESMYAGDDHSNTSALVIYQFNDGSGSVLTDVIHNVNGDMINLGSGDWINSDIPYGYGYSESLQEQTGEIDFGNDVGLKLNYSLQNGASITAGKITVPPNIWPETGSVFQDQYWIINRYGSGEFNADMSLKMNEDINSYDLEYYKLFSRESNSTAPWTFRSVASDRSSFHNSLTFPNISNFSQFIVTGIDLPDANAFYPLNGSDNISVSPTLTIEFDTEVFPGVGSIYIYKLDDHSLVEAVEAVNFQQVNNEFHFSLSTNLLPLTAYYVLIDQNAFFDQYQVHFLGIDDENLWQFTTTNFDNFPGSALTFDGINDYIDLGNSTNLKPTDELSIELWAYEEEWTTIEEQRLINNTQSGGYSIYVGGASNIDAVIRYDGAYHYLTYPLSSLSSGWHHFSMTFDGRYFKFYIDGDLKNESDAGNYYPIEYHPSNHTLIAAEAGSGSIPTGGYFNGKIDEVRIWNGIRTQEEIRENMYLTPTGIETGLVGYWQFNEISGNTLYDFYEDNNGILNNMDNNDWIVSSIPFGDGLANSNVEAMGIVEFGQTGLIMNFDDENGAEITVSRIDTLSYLLPEETNKVFNQQYWVINRFGTGSFNTDITFNLLEDLTTEDELDPSNIKLYTRASNADTNWAFQKSAFFVDAANNEATFKNITHFSQFIIGRDYTMDNYPGFALEFDGVNDYVDIGEPDALKLEAFTISTWFKRTGNGTMVSTGNGGISAEPLVTKGRGEADGNNRDMNYFLGIQGGSQVLCADFEDFASGANHPVLGATTIQNDRWYHAAATYDGTTWKLFLNGNLEAESIENAMPRFDCIQDNAIGSALNSNGTPSGYFKGLIDEVSIWNMALDSIQIREQMHLNLSGMETGLVSYWQCNEGVDNIVHNYISGDHGLLTNMNTNDWVESTIPFGGGVASSQTEISGLVDFSEEGLSIYFNSHNNAEVTVSRIDTVPNLEPALYETVFNNQYWIVNRFGNGMYNTNLTFTLSEDLTVEDESDPSQIELLTRGSFSDTSWAKVTSASAINATNNTATFLGITHFGQFMISKGPQPDIFVQIDSIDFGKCIINTIKSKVLTIENNGITSLEISDVTFLGTAFSVNLNSFSILPQSTYDLDINFLPPELELFLDTLTIVSNDPDNPFINIPLRGKGVQSDGFPGSALDFGGSNDYVQIPDDNSLDLITNYTLAAWIKPDAFSSLDGIIGKYHSSGANGYFLRLSNSAPYSGIGFDGMISENGVLEVGKWHHIAAVNDNGTRRLYINGEEIPLSGAPITVQSNSNNLTIGVDYLSSPRYFNGKIDEVSIWNIALDSTQVREQIHINLTGTETGLVSYWQFNEGSGSTLLDLISGNDGILSNMEETDWIESTIPFGGGFSETEVLSNAGFYDFNNADFKITTYTDADDEAMVVSKITLAPNLFPENVDEVLDDQYWVMYQHGETSLDMDVTFKNIPGISEADEINPSKIKLYRRNFNSDEEWVVHDTCFNVQIFGEFNEVTFENIIDYGQFILVRDGEILDVELEARVFLEGAYGEEGMENNLYPFIPLAQPYNSPPWNYEGTEFVTNPINYEIDWVLIELRDAPDIESASAETMIARQACLLGPNGYIYSTIGEESYPEFNNLMVNDSIYLVIYHRNHLPIISQNALVEGVFYYNYDFSQNIGSAYGSNMIDLGDGNYGLIAADGNADGIINNDDLILWKQHAGTKGYLMEDTNLDSQVDNRDKNDLWIQNEGMSINLPE